MLIDERSDIRYYTLKGRCCSNQFCELSWQNCYTPPAFRTLAFQNELEDHYADVHFNSHDDLSASYRKLVSFCPVNAEFTSLECCLSRARFM